MAGRQLLWTPDPAVWDAVSPLLFPVVGWTRNSCVRVDSAIYPMPVHGFASSAAFEAEQFCAERVRFILRDNGKTRSHYPFAFELSVDYRLSADALAIECRVHNPGQGALPYSIGLHPGFAWPFCGGARSDYRILFEETEAAHVPVIADGGLFSQRRREISLKGRELALTPELFALEALCFLNARSSKLTFGRAGFGALEIATDGFPHWAVWTKPGAPFLCVESWSGHGDPEGFEGELVDKPSITLLAPGASGVHKARFRFRLS